MAKQYVHKKEERKMKKSPERRVILIAQRKARCKERREVGKSSGLILPFCSLLTSVIFFMGLELALIVKLPSKKPAQAAFPSVD